VKKPKSRPVRRTIHRGVMLEHEPPIMQPHQKPPPPGDRILKGKDGSRWFIDGASGRVTKMG
jgi:hypothetical protein